VLKDTPSRSISVGIALGFLLERIDDLHMPPQVGDIKDKGVCLTQVRAFDRGSKMQRVWDSGMIEWIGETENPFIAELAELSAAENVDIPVRPRMTRSEAQACLSPRVIPPRFHRPKQPRLSLRASV
jgi:hypothetical protein